MAKLVKEKDNLVKKISPKRVKVRTTLMLDGDVLKHFKGRVGRTVNKLLKEKMQKEQD